MLDEIRDRRLHPSLPVFALEHDQQAVVYVPGHVMPVAQHLVPQLEAYWDGSPSDGTTPGLATLAHRLEEVATQVAHQWQTQRDRDFQPECLNLQLGYACHLACGYCYASSARAGAGDPQPSVNHAAVTAAAEVVAACCADLHKPFHFVVQGVGEPTLPWETLRRCVAHARAVAARHALDWCGHITTNGQFSEQQAACLAEDFRSVSLSCDGPPDVQDRQRPRRDGGASSAWVERAAETLLRLGVDVEVRATITPNLVFRMGELVQYVADRLHVSRLRVEPVFQAESGFAPAAAKGFAYEFLLAERRAASCGVDVCLCSPRLDELHGPLCESARNSLRVMPDGTAVNCFLSVAAPQFRATSIGGFDSATGAFVLDHETIRAMQNRAGEIPAPCRDCFNQLHCNRSCPEACPWTGGEWSSGFRCLLQKQLARQWIWRAAGTVNGGSAGLRSAPVAGRMSSRPMPQYLAGLPKGIDPHKIVDEWQRAAVRYRLEDREMPSPPWARGGFPVTGREAWERLRQQANLPTGKGLSIYIHVPFCVQHCRFCDCHSFPLRKQQARDYGRVLVEHLHAWAEETTLGSRPVTTVHLGGGTPNCLGEGALEQLVEACRRCFAIRPETELAIETTASLSEEHELARLQRLGFTRLHVGVQTLDPRLRQALGRRTPVAGVLERLQRALTMGYVTSVDVLYGLPGQDVTSLINTLSGLIGSGLHGVSLYRLNLSQKNRAFLRRFPDFRRDAIADYVMLQCAEQLLGAHGYRKNHFVHYALSADKNLYFRHAIRGEDLLAVGASASGTLGRWDYRWQSLPAYLEQDRSVARALEGAVCPVPSTKELRQAEVMMMCGELHRALFVQLGCGDLLTTWEHAGLVRPDSQVGCYLLTGTGSWMLSPMVEELRLHSRP